MRRRFEAGDRQTHRRRAERLEGLVAVANSAQAVDRAELAVSVEPTVVRLCALDPLLEAVVMLHAADPVEEAVPAKGT